MIEGSVETSVMIECCDPLRPQSDKRSYGLLDNAPMHRSKAFLQHMPQWVRKGVMVKSRLGRLSWLVATYYAGINTSKMCSQLWPWANSCSTSLSRLCNASRAIVRTRCPMVMVPCANANLSVADPEAGVCWSNDCATQLKRKWRWTASSLRP